MKKLLLSLLSTTTLTFTMTACVGNSQTDGTGGTNNNTQVAAKSAASSSQPIKAAYMDLYATGSFSEIRSEGFANSNMLIFGFAKIDQSVMPDDVKKRITTAMDSAPENAIGLLSIGGAVDEIHDNQIQQTIDNVVSQINDYNNNHSRKISGVDLDLENGISADITLALAKGFKQKNLIVAAAPQLNGLVANTDSSAPKGDDLVLTSGGSRAIENTYQLALNAKSIDYLLVQTYNTGWFQIDGHTEADEKFFISAARALSKLAGKSVCSNEKELCIPATTKLVIGTVANAGSAFDKNQNNIFGAFPGQSYDQQKTLDVLINDIHSMEGNADFNNVSGVMMWALGNDYAPNLYGDYSAKPGSFTNTIFKNMNKAFGIDSDTPKEGNIPYFNVVSPSFVDIKGRNHYTYGITLQQGDAVINKLHDNSKGYKAVLATMQKDNNFVVYYCYDEDCHGNGDVGFASNTTNNDNPHTSFATFQKDGNFVIYADANKSHAIYSAFDNKYGEHAQYSELVLQDDGNLVIYNSITHKALWGMGTTVGEPSQTGNLPSFTLIQPSSTLASGAKVYNAAQKIGQYHALVTKVNENTSGYKAVMATMRADNNFAVYFCHDDDCMGSGDLVFSTNVKAGDYDMNGYAILQSFDGNFVLYSDSEGKSSIYSAFDNNYASSHAAQYNTNLTLQPDGNLVIYEIGTQRALWSTNTIVLGQIAPVNPVNPDTPSEVGTYVVNNGDWNSGKNYSVEWYPAQKFPLVTHNGHSYVACSDTQAGQEPGSTSGWNAWELYDNNDNAVSCLKDKTIQHV